MFTCFISPLSADRVSGLTSSCYDVVIYLLKYGLLFFFFFFLMFSMEFFFFLHVWVFEKMNMLTKLFFKFFFVSNKGFCLPRK